MAGFFNPFAGGAGGKAPTASEIPYDGSSSGISATDVQGAIDEVQENIENIPRPMSYQGTLGVGGEITELPAPSEANRGYTYKVVTAGTYQGITAEVGDTFISYATRWDLVPSGDEPGGTVLSVGVTSNDGSVTVTGSPVTTTGSIDVSVNVDNELSDTSTKPVQNKIVTLAINEKLDIDDAVGKNVTGTEYTIDGQTVIAGNGAEIFNDYANNKAAGLYSHAEGNVTTASGDYSHAEGRGAKASGENSHAEGFYTKATGNASHAEGSSNASGQYSHAEGSSSNASGQNSHAEGNNGKASGQNSHAEGYGTMAVGDESHAEGQGGGSKNYTSSTSNSTILSDYSTYPFTLAKGRSSHCEGNCTLALGECSHSEGYRTKSVSDYSHAEGYNTRTDGNYSHAEGYNTRTNSDYSHTEGQGTIATSSHQHVQGKYNVEDANDTYAFIIGNGIADNARHNAFAIDWDGNIYQNNSNIGVNLVDQQKEIDYAINAGGKNLLKNVRTTTTHRGITFTVNNDGSVTASGTNDGTGASLLNINTQESLALSSGYYILSGCPAGGSETSYFMDITRSSGASIKDTGNGVTFIVGGDYTINEIRIAISRNVTVDNLTFYPMIRHAEITDDTFVPYRPSYDNLIDEVNQLKNYIGYEKSWILGLQVDYQNKTFIRLGKAADLTLNSDFNQFNIYNKRRRCNVSDDGTINAFYGESGYIEDGTNGQVMVYQPKFYYKVEPLKLEPIVDGEGYHIRKANYYISETPRNGFKLHPAFKDENGNELEYYLIGAYEASLYDVSESTYILDDAQVADFSADKICSIANAKPISGLTQNLTRSNCEKLATNRGIRWHNMTIQIASAEQLLFMIEYGKMNAQEVIGKGVVNKASGEVNESINTGSTSNLGNASGAASGTDGLVSITYRGVENLWGNIWSWIDGVNIWGDGTKKGGIPYITDKLSFVENTKTDYNSAGFTTSGTNGYISAMGYGNPDYDWVFFASETTGNSTLPVGDYQYYTTNLNGYRVAVLGGGWNSGLVAGLFYWALHYSSSTRYRAVGGRGVIIPDINATNYWTNIHKAS